MTIEQYREWLGVARRFSRRPDEAEDLLHDSLLAACRQGYLDFTGESTRRWLTGVIKNTAAMTARTAARRRQREERQKPAEANTTVEARPETGDILDCLSPAARSVAVLALHGLDRKEICYALGIADTALRQRLSSIRRSIGQLPAPLRAEAMALAYRQPRADDPALEFGLIRRALLASVRRFEGIASHDPDGHLFIIGAPPSQNGIARQRKENKCSKR